VSPVTFIDRRERDNCPEHGVYVKEEGCPRCAARARIDSALREVARKEAEEKP
jgi:hypothetical protein